MASSRRTLDVDTVTLRTVNIRGPQNTLISSSLVLASDGRGGTYWVAPSVIGSYPSFTSFQVDGTTYTARPTASTFSLQPGPGIGFSDAGPGLNTSYVYSKAFQTIQVPGLTSLQASSNAALTSNLTFSSIEGVTLSTDTVNQTLFFRTSLQYLAILSNTSSLSQNPSPVTRLPITAAFSTLTFTGLGDIYMQTNPLQNRVDIGIRGFTSQGYQALSTQVYTLPSTNFGLASTFLVSKEAWSTSLSNLSSSSAFALSTLNYYVNYSTFSTVVGSNLSTYSTLNQVRFSTLTSTTYSILSTLSTSAYSNLSTLSTSAYYMNQSTLSSFIYVQLTSTTAGFSTLTTTTYSNLSTTLGSYGGGISTIELLSTTSMLLSSISTLNVQVNSSVQTYLSTMSTGIANFLYPLIVPKVSIVSSLTYAGTAGDSVPFYRNVSSLLFSTATLNFSKIASSIHDNATMTLEYNPVLLFPMSKQYGVQPQNFCTILKYADGSIMNSSLFQDSLTLYQYGTDTYAGQYYSNVYSKYIRMSLDSAFIATHGVSNYTIFHYSPTAAGFLNNLPVSSSTLHIRTPPTNSLFLSLFNTV
jgi:hypothetical protein